MNTITTIQFAIKVRIGNALLKTVLMELLGLFHLNKFRITPNRRSDNHSRNKVANLCFLPHRGLERSLYTFLLQYSEGTYISQVRAFNVLDATEEWAANLNPDIIRNLSKASKVELVASIPDIIEAEGIAAIEELTNVWAFSYVFPKGLALINIVKTSSEPIG